MLQFKSVSSLSLSYALFIAIDKCVKHKRGEMVKWQNERTQILFKLNYNHKLKRLFRAVIQHPSPFFQLLDGKLDYVYPWLSIIVHSFTLMVMVILFVEFSS